MNRHYILSLILLICALFIAGCGANPTSQGPKTIYVTVVDSETQSGIKGATLEINGKSSVTSDNGTVSLEGLSGTINYTVKATDYLTTKGSFTVNGTSTIKIPIDNYKVGVVKTAEAHLAFMYNSNQARGFQTPSQWEEIVTSDYVLEDRTNENNPNIGIVVMDWPTVKQQMENVRGTATLTNNQIEEYVSQYQAPDGVNKATLESKLVADFYQTWGGNTEHLQQDCDAVFVMVLKDGRWKIQKQLVRVKSTTPLE